MIIKFTDVKKFGIFESIPAEPGYDEFRRFNLFYGFNGSGKSTLAHLFSQLESKDFINRFPDAKWKCKLKSGDILDETSSMPQEQIVRVFDKGFVNLNINWNDLIKGILIVSKESKEDIDALEKAKGDQKINNDALKKINEELNGEEQGKRKRKKGIVEKNSDFLSDASKRIKGKFKLIEVKDSYLANYNKTKLENYLNDNQKQINETKELTAGTIERLSQSIKPQDKEKISLLEELDFDIFKIKHTEINLALKEKLTSSVIKGLKDNYELSEWVKKGLELNKEGTACAFCGNAISIERITTLNNHFSDAFRKLQDSLNSLLLWVNDFDLPEFPSKDSFYREFQKDYEKSLSELLEQKGDLIKALDDWKKAITHKSANPFEEHSNEIKNIEIEKLRKSYETIVELIKNHNKKVANEESIIKESKEKLEIQYVKDELKIYDYYNQKKEAERKFEAHKEISENISKLEILLVTLNAKVSTEALGANKFNTDLHKFLGRNELSLIPQPQGGYKIQRGDDQNTKGEHLSEGEKTAIAFVYFINKLKEDDNKIEDTVVVIDDPLSSFDSNNVHNAYSYLIKHCTDSKQLFVLTHNFMFFRLLRDYYQKRNENVEKKNKKAREKNELDKIKELVTNIYAIQAFSVGEKRQSKIDNADETLITYGSEYHFLFKQLLQQKDSPKFSIMDAFIFSNAARKVLETFLRFKYPKYRGNFREWLNQAIKESPSQIENEELIYKFINKYSHSDGFESDTTDNQLGESQNIVNNILKLIEDVDKTHYNEMCEICNN